MEVKPPGTFDDLEAEARVLGSLLELPQPRLRETLATIEADTFASPQHRRVLNGIVTLASRLLEGETIDGPELVQAVAQNGDWLQLTGFIATAIRDAYAPRNVKRSIDRLNRLARKRCVAGATNRLLTETAEGLIEPAEAQAVLGEILSANRVAETGAKLEPIPEFRPRLVNLAGVATQAVNWLWHRRIARESITLLTGRPGQGKSMVAADLAARVTTGRSWPNEPPNAAAREPANVLFVAVEDSLGMTMRPRVDIACGDPARVTVLQVVLDREDAEHLFHVERHAPGLRAAIREVGGVALVIVDPIGSCMGGIDSHRHTDVYAALTPLRSIAEECGCAVLAVHHHNKAGGTGSAMDAVMGSVGFVAVARNVWSCIDDPEAPDGSCVRMFAHAKSNLSALQDALRYEVRESDQGVGYVAWHAAAVHATADQLVAAGKDRIDGRRKGPGQSEVDRACEWIRGTLADGPIPASMFSGGAVAAGISQATLRRAREITKVTSTRDVDDRGRARGWLVGVRP